jgi:hypothetical protein
MTQFVSRNVVVGTRAQRLRRLHHAESITASRLRFLGLAAGLRGART